MKCISLWQPWAQLVVLGAKQFETRSWETSYRGPLLIHAARRPLPKGLIPDEPFWTALGGKPWNPDLIRQVHGASVGDIYESLAFGAIIGRVEVVDVYEITSTGLIVRFTHRDQHPTISRTEAAFGDYTVGRFAWKLSNPVRFETPIPYRGMQQLFNMPDEVVATLAAQTRKVER